jgi:nucleoside-diphosphate-sugar epimerase
VKELAGMMLKLALEYPEYRDNAKKVRLVSTTAAQYYGKGYQDVQNRVPKITGTTKDLGWKPQVGMRQALKHIFDAYRTQIQQASELVE